MVYLSIAVALWLLTLPSLYWNLLGTGGPAAHSPAAHARRKHAKLPHFDAEAFLRRHARHAQTLVGTRSDGSTSRYVHPAFRPHILPWTLPSAAAAAAGQGPQSPSRSAFRASRLFDWDMAYRLKRVDEYVGSAAYRQALAAVEQLPQRGILINAGGPRLLTNAIVALRTLRSALNCSLPVALVWHGPGEMDNATLAGLRDQFAPLEGFDLLARPYPAHARQQSDTLSGYALKAYSLLHAPFQV